MLCIKFKLISKFSFDIQGLQHCALHEAGGDGLHKTGVC